MLGNRDKSLKTKTRMIAITIDATTAMESDHIGIERQPQRPRSPEKKAKKGLLTKTYRRNLEAHFYAHACADGDCRDD